MTGFRVEAQVSVTNLLKAVRQLSLPEMESFIHQVIALQAQRKAPSLSQAEAELLLIINQGLPPSLRTRYAELIAKRKTESLSSDEHGELLRLTEQVEKLEVQRVELLAELAHVRKTTLSALMKELGLRKPSHV